MKKIQIVIVMFIICVFLTACDPGHYSYEYDELIDKVVKVELINYDNSKQKRFISWVPDYSSSLAPFILSNMTILETLDTEDIPAFIKQLSEVSILYKYYTFNSPKDICIRMIYENDDFEIINCDYKNNSFHGYIGKYRSSGEVDNYIGSFTNVTDFELLIDTFFETKLT